VENNLVSKRPREVEDERWKYGEKGFEEGKHF
jgi:hypothetical protein